MPVSVRTGRVPPGLGVLIRDRIGCHGGVMWVFSSPRPPDPVSVCCLL